MPSKFRFKFDFDINKDRFFSFLNETMIDKTKCFREGLLEAIGNDFSQYLCNGPIGPQILTYETVVSDRYTKNNIFSSVNDAISLVEKSKTDKWGCFFLFEGLKLSFSASIKLAKHSVDFVLPSRLMFLDTSFGVPTKSFDTKVWGTNNRSAVSVRAWRANIAKALLSEYTNLRHNPCKCLDEWLMFKSALYPPYPYLVCKGCGERFICECFLPAIEKLTAQANAQVMNFPSGWHKTFLLDSKTFKVRKYLCHLCRKHGGGIFFESNSAPVAEQTIAPYVFLEQILIGEKGRRAEDRAREKLGIPLVGDEWVGERNLYQATKAILKSCEVLRGARLPWLGRQHLDVYVPDLGIAIEYQGQQHFQPVDFFGGEEAYKKTVERDKKKAELCQANGIILLHLTYEDQVDKSTILRLLKPHMTKQKKDFS